jgi:hypothetical protein
MLSRCQIGISHRLVAKMVSLLINSRTSIIPCLIGLCPHIEKGNITFKRGRFVVEKHLGSLKKKLFKGYTKHIEMHVAIVFSFWSPIITNCITCYMDEMKYTCGKYFANVGIGLGTCR